ncbi:hypothetical protein MC885_019598, partial [Smutsia gigantea]
IHLQGSAPGRPLPAWRCHISEPTGPSAGQAAARPRPGAREQTAAAEKRGAVTHRTAGGGTHLPARSPGRVPQTRSRGPGRSERQKQSARKINSSSSELFRPLLWGSVRGTSGFCTYFLLLLLLN